MSTKSKVPAWLSERCAPRGKLTREERKRLPDAAFIGPHRSFPMFKIVNGKMRPSPGHARAALGRAKMALDAGTIGPREYRKIVATARDILRACDGF